MDIVDFFIAVCVIMAFLLACCIVRYKNFTVWCLTKAHKHLIKGEDYQFYKWMDIVMDDDIAMYKQEFCDIFLHSDEFSCSSDADKIKTCTDIFAKFAYIDSMYSDRSFEDIYRHLTDITVCSVCFCIARHINFSDQKINKGKKKFRKLYREVVDESFMKFQKNLENS